MTDPLIIRSVSQTDFAQWLPLWEGYNRFYGRDALPVEIMRMTWSRFFDEGEPVYALVAERDGRLVGLAHSLFHRSTIQIELSAICRICLRRRRRGAVGLGGL